VREMKHCHTGDMFIKASIADIIETK